MVFTAACSCTGNHAARRYAEDADRAIAALEASGHGLAAFIVDSAFVSHGILDVPAGWLEAVAARVRAATCRTAIGAWQFTQKLPTAPFVSR